MKVLSQENSVLNPNMFEGTKIKTYTYTLTMVFNGLNRLMLFIFLNQGTLRPTVSNEEKLITNRKMSNCLALLEISVHGHGVHSYCDVASLAESCALHFPLGRGSVETDVSMIILWRGGLSSSELLLHEISRDGSTTKHHPKMAAWTGLFSSRPSSAGPE